MTCQAVRRVVALQDYLTTTYRPDCEYLEGELLERNVGEWDHSKPTRFRVPDVCVVIGPEPQEQILSSPLFLCIEIFSRDDRMTEIRERIQDYLRLSVRYVWVLDPRVRGAFAFTGAGVSQAVDQVCFRRKIPNCLYLSRRCSSLIRR